MAFKFKRHRKFVPRLVFHIGQHKTGTTAIQQFLNEHRDELGNKGLVYPETMGPFEGHHEIPIAVSSGDLMLPAYRKNWKKDDGYSFQKQLTRHSDASNEALHAGKSCVFSSEMLLQITGDSVATMHQAFELSKRDTIILAYIRSPIDGFASRMQQSIGHQPLLRAPRWHLGFRHFKIFKDHFGDQLMVRKYAKGGVNKGDLIDDFLGVLGFSKTGQPEEARGLSNNSLSSEASVLLQFLNLNGVELGYPLSDGGELNRWAISKVDQRVGEYSGARIHQHLYPLINRLSTDALKIRDLLGIHFEDLDYTEIGKPVDMKEEDFRYSWNIFDFSKMRLAELCSAIEKDPVFPERITAITAECRFEFS